VPNVNFNPDDGKVNVNNWNLDNANDNMRFRPEVSRKNGAKELLFALQNLSNRLPFLKFL